MRNKTKNLISTLLPLSSIFAVFIVVIILRTQTVGFAGYIDVPLYRLNGSIAVSLEEKIPADSYIRIRIDDYIIKMNIIDFLERSGKPYKVYGEEVIADDTYIVDFDSLGITEGFRKGIHKIIIEIIHDGVVLHREEEMIGI